MLISVVVPIYNIDKYVERCIDSILAQTYTNIEIILVDDGSTDMSGAICDRYQEKNAKVKAYHIPNQGPVVARQYGVLHAGGEYVVFVDGDDYIDNTWISNAVDCLSVTHPSMLCMNGMSKEYEQGQRTGFECQEVPVSQILANMCELKRGLQINYRWNLVLWCIRRDILCKAFSMVNPNVKVAEDFLAVLFSIINGTSVSVLNAAGYHYCSRDGSLTHSHKSLQNNYKLVYDNFVSCVNSDDEYYDVCKATVQKIIITALLLSDFNLFCDFAFSKSFDRAIIYGCGKFGQAIIDDCLDNKRFDIERIVDGYHCGESYRGFLIDKKETVLESECDIIVAALQERLICEMENELINMGVDRSRICTIHVKSIYEHLVENGEWHL